MFAFKPLKEMETAIRVALIAVILFNAVIPTTASARTEPKPGGELTNEAGLNMSRSLPEQKPIYFNPPIISESQRTSPNPDKSKSPVPPKDQVEFTLVASPAIVPANGLVSFIVSIRNNSDKSLVNLTFTDHLENGLVYSPTLNDLIVYNEKTSDISLDIDSINAGEVYSFTYSVTLTPNKRNASKEKIWLHDVALNSTDSQLSLKTNAAIGIDLSGISKQSEIVALQSIGGWNQLGRIAVYMEKDNVGQNVLVIASPTKINGKGPDLQFALDIYEASSIASDTQGEFNEQELSIKKENKNAFKKSAFLEINLDGYIDLKNIPGGQEPYVATYDELNKVWVKIPIIAQ